MAVEASNTNPVLHQSTEPLRLSSFRQSLIRQEETIIFALIERAQFPLNSPVYSGDGTSRHLGGQCLLDFLLKETELVHARTRRYTSPDERAFFREAEVLTPLLPLIDFPQVLRSNNININDKIKKLYTQKVLPTICESATDVMTLGSSAAADIACLQALSKRIHFGKFIAEAKFQESPQEYTALIESNDAEAIMQRLTCLVQEERVLNRVEKKASAYGQDPDSGEAPVYKVDPKVIRGMYQDIVMPLTKEVQVAYLLQRLTHSQVVCSGPAGSAAHLAAKKYFRLPEANLSVVPGDRADSVFSAVLSNEAANGVVVFETERAGSMREVKQLLVNSNLKITAEIILDGGDMGQTRCIVIGKTGASPSGSDKCCVAFGTSHDSGALHRALGAFHNQGVNMCSLESLPCGQPRLPGSYDFLVELEGALEDPPIKKALDDLRQEATFVNLLGTYARACVEPAAGGA